MEHFFDDQDNTTPSGDIDYTASASMEQEEPQPQRLTRTDDIESEDDDLFGDRELSPMESKTAANEDENENDQNDNGNDSPDDTMMDLFGSDGEEEDGNQNMKSKENSVNTEDAKVLSKSYSRTAPKGKKTSISTRLNMSQLPNTEEFEFCLLRLPNVIGCDTEAFDEHTYVAPKDTSSVDNYIRWRKYYEAASDETYRESNTKLVYWKDGTKSLMIGNDCYDIDEQDLHGNRDFLYAQLEDSESQAAYKLCHGKLAKRMSVRTSTSKSYKTMQRNLAKKHQRATGMKQMTQEQRNRNRKQKERGPTTQRVIKNRTKKKNISEEWLESGGQRDSSDDDEEEEYRSNSNTNTNRNRNRNDQYSESESDDEESDDEDTPIGNRMAH